MSVNAFIPLLPAAPLVPAVPSVPGTLTVLTVGQQVGWQQELRVALIRHFSLDKPRKSMRESSTLQWATRLQNKFPVFPALPSVCVAASRRTLLGWKAGLL